MTVGGFGRTDSRKTKQIAPAIKIRIALAVPKPVFGPGVSPTSPRLKASKIAPKIRPLMPASCSIRFDVYVKQ